MAKKGKRVVTRDANTVKRVYVNKGIVGKRPAGGVPFKPGNNFWTKRSDHATGYLFETPEHLLEGAIEYFQHVDANPEYVIEARSEDGMIVNHPVPKRRPYTPEGLAIWLGSNVAYFRTFKSQQQDNPKAAGFLEAIAWIENVIYNQQYTGAAVGTLNASIVARRLGISETLNIGSGAPVQAPQLNVYNTGPRLAAHEDEVQE